MWYKFSGKKDLDIITKNHDISRYVIEKYPITKFQTTIAFFLVNGINDEKLSKLYHYLQVLNNKKSVEIFANSNAVYYNKQKYTDYNILMHQLSISYNLTLNSNRNPEKDKIINDIINQPEVSVIKIDSSEDACDLGAGSLWCVARPGDSNFLNFKRLGYTFYLVIDNNSTFTDEYSDRSDEYRRVMISVEKNGSISCYDLNNENIDTKKYLQYLKSINVDITQFKNTEKYNQKLFENAWHGVSDYDYFEMPYKEKLYYNQYSHNGLSNNKLSFLIKNNANELINAYMKSNFQIPESQLKMVSEKQRDVYKKYRDKNFNQIVNGLKNNPDEIASHAIAYKDKRLIDYLIDNGLDNSIEEFLYLIDTSDEFGQYISSRLREQQDSNLRPLVLETNALAN